MQKKILFLISYFTINHKFLIDFFILLTLCILTIHFTIHFDLFEKVIHFSQKYETVEIDEIILSLAFISFYILIFTLRRLFDIKHLRKQADTDSLVNVFNRRKGTELIYNQLNRNTNAAEASLIMFDIDNFKFINDTYGHNIGDYVLIKIISILEKKSRYTDIFI